MKPEIMHSELPSVPARKQGNIWINSFHSLFMPGGAKGSITRQQAGCACHPARRRHYTDGPIHAAKEVYGVV